MHKIARHTQARPRNNTARSLRAAFAQVGTLAAETLALASLAAALFSGLMLLAGALA